MALRPKLDFRAARLMCRAAMLTITNLTYRIQGRPLFEGASLVLPDGAKAGFVGKNGSGKTTLFNLIQGHIARRCRLDRGQQAGPDRRRGAGSAGHRRSACSKP